MFNKISFLVLLLTLPAIAQKGKVMWLADGTYYCGDFKDGKIDTGELSTHWCDVPSDVEIKAHQPVHQRIHARYTGILASGSSAIATLLEQLNYDSKTVLDKQLLANQCITYSVEGNPLPTSCNSDTFENPYTKIVKLTDEEWKHLESLREAVTEEEERLVSQYGGALNDYCVFNNLTSAVNDVPLDCRKKDEWHFHGQFLLIDKGDAPKIPQSWMVLSNPANTEKH